MTDSIRLSQAIRLFRQIQFTPSLPGPHAVVVNCRDLRPEIVK